MMTLMKRAAVFACLAAPAVAASDGDTKIVIDNFKFAPATVTVGQGTSVTWTNGDDIPHSIVLQALGAWSKALDTDQTFSYRFDKAGTYAYICGLHPFMRGQIVVQ